METIEIKINRHKEVICGIKLSESDYWIVINENPRDFITKK